ncbi:hypothetical protein GQX74_012717 [Glossina fuscipes]|nr:hypothetical protein GQX74_012717 [Glossina fuscipes]
MTEAFVALPSRPNFYGAEPQRNSSPEINEYNNNTVWESENTSFMLATTHAIARSNSEKVLLKENSLTTAVRTQALITQLLLIPNSPPILYTTAVDPSPSASLFNIAILVSNIFIVNSPS